ncbi:hypothetical protein BT69DRAFT_265539 [Atractiella rhizophila]|nr:hypothetical protein BT69DRAFT_265539 [Atractiella rhizophila]
MFALWLSLLLFALSRAQDFPYNVTDITGTWCSGWGNTVVTGPVRLVPSSFYPPTSSRHSLILSTSHSTLRRQEEYRIALPVMGFMKKRSIAI